MGISPDEMEGMFAPQLYRAKRVGSMFRAVDMGESENLICKLIDIIYNADANKATIYHALCVMISLIISDIPETKNYNVFEDIVALLDMVCCDAFEEEN